MKGLNINKLRNDKTFRTISSKEALKDVTPIYCEWDIIKNIFQKAINKQRLTKEQVNETSERILREVRERGNKQ